MLLLCVSALSIDVCSCCMSVWVSLSSSFLICWVRNSCLASSSMSILCMCLIYSVCSGLLGDYFFVFVFEFILLLLKVKMIVFGLLFKLIDGLMYTD